MGPSTSSTACGWNSLSPDIPYTSEVDGKITRLRYFTHWRINGRLASKSSFEYRSGFAHVGCWRRNCDQRQDHVAFADVVTRTHSWLIVNVASKKVKARVADERAHAVVLHVHAQTCQSVAGEDGGGSSGGR